MSSKGRTNLFFLNLSKQRRHPRGIIYEIGRPDIYQGVVNTYDLRVQYSKTIKSMIWFDYSGIYNYNYFGQITRIYYLKYQKKSSSSIIFKKY